MPRPNILLVILDSVRAQNCSLYGHKNQTTPFLSKFSKQSTLFEHAHSPSIQSISSHASIFSGHHTNQHQLHNLDSYLDPDDSIWQKLTDKYGYKTGLFSPNSVVTQSSNLASVFGTVVGPKQTRSDFVLFDHALSPKDFPKTSVPDFIRKAITSDHPIQSLVNGAYYRFCLKNTRSYHPEKENATVYVDEFLDWVPRQERPWGACINLMDAHIPYIPREKYNMWADSDFKKLHDKIDTTENIPDRMWGYLHAIQSLYDGCIRQADAGLNRLLTTLEEGGVLDDTFVVITSDHGEAFGERSRINSDIRLFGHNHGIPEVLTHVPLIVKEPGQTKPDVEGRAATLTNFPKSVHAAISGRDAASAFVPEDGVVLSSCKRSVSDKFAADGQSLPDDEVWRAVYHDIEDDDAVMKHATWGDHSVSVHVRDAQTSYIVKGDSANVVESEYEGLDDVNAKVGDSENRELGGEVQDRLAELGYLDG